MGSCFLTLGKICWDWAHGPAPVRHFPIPDPHSPTVTIGQMMDTVAIRNYVEMPGNAHFLLGVGGLIFTLGVITFLVKWGKARHKNKQGKLTAPVS